MQAPILSGFEISGKFSKSTLSNFLIVSKFIVSEFKSVICELKSLIFPFLSNAAGFSFPLTPTLNSFRVILFLIY